MSARSLTPLNRLKAFSLLEVVVAVGIFAFAVIAIIGLLLPNTSAVEKRIEADVVRRLTENIQSELQRYLRATSETQKGGANAGEGLYDFDNLFYNGAPAGRTNAIYLVATRDGSRVLVTGEDPYLAWNDTYADPYIPAAATYTAVATPPVLAAENNLISDPAPGNPPGIAFRDRYYLIEVSLPDSPKHRQTNVPSDVAIPFIPLSVRVLWPYRLPDGPENVQNSSKYNTFTDLPWSVVSPAKHSSFIFNIALTP